MASRLWDALGVDSYAFVLARTPVGTLDLHDDQIVSMTLTRGSGVIVGSTTNTATIRLRDAQWPLTFDAATIDINLSNAGLAAFRAKTGGYEGSSVYSHPVYQRWHGRIAGQKVTDTGDRREPQWVTDLTCVDPMPLVSDVNAGAQVTRSAPQITALVGDMLDRSGIAFPNQLSTLTQTAHEVYFAAGDPDTKTIPVSTVLGHYIGDMGSLLRVNRIGSPQLLDHAYRGAAAANWQEACPYPITRASAIAPTGWTQRVTVPHGVHWDQSGNWGWDVWVGSNNPAVGKWPTETLNMKDVQLVGGQPGVNTPLMDPMTARVYRSSRDGYAVDQLSFDILDLLNRPDPGQRRLAALLLTAEPGDSLALAKDWPYQTKYGEIHTVTRVTEKISADAWTVDVDLAPIAWVTGRPSPGFDYDTWDYGYPRGWSWDNTYGTRWDDAP